MNSFRRICATSLVALTGLICASTVVAGAAHAAVIDVNNQQGTLSGVQTYKLPTLKVTDTCITKGGFNEATSEYTWNYEVTVKNTRSRTAALHIRDRNPNLRIDTKVWRVVVLRPGQTQTLTVHPLDVVNDSDIDDSLTRTLDISGADVTASKSQYRKMRQGKPVKGFVSYSQSRNRSMPVTVTGAQACEGEQLPDNSSGSLDGNENQASRIYPFTGAEIMSDVLPPASYLSQFDGFHENRDRFMASWKANSIRGWDDAAAGKRIAVTTFDLDTFLAPEALSASDTAYLSGYLRGLGYFDYRSSIESRAERLAGAPSSVRTIEWVHEYTQGWELAVYYEQYPYWK